MVAIQSILDPEARLEAALRDMESFSYDDLRPLVPASWSEQKFRIEVWNATERIRKNSGVVFNPKPEDPGVWCRATELSDVERGAKVPMPRDACPWCMDPWRGGRIEHTADCPAFSAPGEVRR